MQAIIKRNDPLYRQIVSYFEEEIQQGRLKPGDRIPATTRLSEIFNVNPDTVQQSLKLLAERGFVSRAPGRGTFVRKGINSRTFGIIFKRTVLTDEDVSFYSGFLNDFILLAEQEQWNCRLFMVTENLSPEDASGEKGLLDLKKAIADGEVRAVVEFCTNPTVRDYLRTECPVPVSLCDVSMDNIAFIHKGVNYLEERGYRDIAVFAYHLDRPNNFDEGISTCHSKLPLRRFDAVDANHNEGYRLMRELCGSRSGLPDALLIANDRLFIGAWYFLLEKGIRVPEELAVLTHANRGRLPMSHIPLTRLEVDPLALTREVFREIAGKITGDAYTARPVTPELIVGRSCGEAE